MWTHERLKAKNWTGQFAYYKQYKYNGHRLTLFNQDNGKLVAFERTIRPDRELTVLRPHIVDYKWWKKLQAIMPPRSSVDGEIYVIRGNAGDAAHALADGLDTLEFMPFAVPWWEGKNLQSYRLEPTKELLQTNGFIPFAPFFRLRPEDTREQLIEDAIDLDIEGWVLKKSNYSNWYKVKPTKDVDCIVTGFADGNGKYLGLVGSLKCSVYIDGELREIANVSGMDDATRVAIDEQEDLGRVCEVTYQSVGNGNRLIHAHFSRWRIDKPAHECVYTWNDLK